MSFREWVQNIGAHREAAKKAKADSEAEAKRREEGREAGKHRAEMAEKAKTELAGAILAESHKEERIKAAQERVAQAGGAESSGFTQAEIDEALEKFKPTEGPEAETGQALGKAFDEYERKQAGGKK